MCTFKKLPAMKPGFDEIYRTANKKYNVSTISVLIGNKRMLNFCRSCPLVTNTVTEFLLSCY